MHIYVQSFTPIYEYVLRCTFYSQEFYDRKMWWGVGVNVSDLCAFWLRAFGCVLLFVFVFVFVFVYFCCYCCCYCCCYFPAIFVAAAAAAAAIFNVVVLVLALACMLVPGACVCFVCS